MRNITKPWLYLLSAFNFLGLGVICSKQVMLNTKREVCLHTHNFTVCKFLAKNLTNFDEYKNFQNSITKLTLVVAEGEKSKVARKENIIKVP